VVVDLGHVGFAGREVVPVPEAESPSRATATGWRLRAPVVLRAVQAVGSGRTQVSVCARVALGTRREGMG
jgi:hypothetical protein